MGIQEPIRKASGWARVDVDGSISFYDSASRKIYSWMRNGGIIAEVDLSASHDKKITDYVDVLADRRLDLY